MVDIAKALGIGTYTTKDGKVITYKDLPPDVQKEVDSMGPMRDLTDMAGDPKIHGSPGQAEQQRAINELYEPSTRDAAMRRRTGERIVEELGRRLSKRDR